MAIGHLHVGIVQRSAGKSSIDAAAYATRSRIVDQRTGQVYDYSRKADDLEVSWLMVPAKARGIVSDTAQFFNMVESRETRVNSQVAKTVEFAIPHELDEQQRKRLVTDFAREQFMRRGIAAQVAIHKPHAWGDQRNYHAHIVIPTRFIDEHGLGAKDREGNKVEALVELRVAWEKLANRYLEKHGHEARISMQSLEAQGIDRTPQVHIGPVASALERKGIETDRGDQVRSIANDNEKVQSHRARTEGRAHASIAQPVEVERAVDRQKREDAEERAAAIKQAEADERRHAYRVDPAKRTFASAIWGLAASAGASLAHVFGFGGGTLASELKHGRHTQLANDNRSELSRQQIAAHKEREAFAAELRGDPVRQEAPVVAPVRPPRQESPEERVFVDRGNRAVPYRAMLGELRDNELDEQQGSGTSPITEPSRENALEPLREAPTREETLIEKIDRHRREKGQRELTELLRSPTQAQEIDRELEL